jgi:hypothetical protein
MFDYTNFPNVLINSIFTDEQYKKLYYNVANNDKKFLDRIDDTGYMSHGDPVDPELFDAIAAKMEQVVGKKLKKYMSHYARYCNDGTTSPMLRPHYDKGLDVATVSMTIILDSTLDWDIGTEIGSFAPRKNQGVTFSGSHQFHWRPYKQFTDSDYYDILVCQFTIEDETDILDQEHRDYMDAKSASICDTWNKENNSKINASKNELKVEGNFVVASAIMDTMNTPIKPVAFDHFFTQEEVESIYKTVNDMMDKGVADTGDKYQYMTKLTNNGFIAILSPEPFEKSIAEKFRSKAAELISNPAPVGFLFARYTWDSGDAPSLMPHCDRSEKKMGLYGTVELDKTIDWDFYVEDEKFEMVNNRSVWFTGTHQPHWRPDKDFAPNDYYDIIICQTHSLDDEVLLTEEDRDIMDIKASECAQKHKDLLVNGLLKQYSEDGCQ